MYCSSVVGSLLCVISRVTGLADWFSNTGEIMT